MARRGDDEETTQEGQEFTAGAKLQHLEAKDAAHGGYVRGLYDITIDIGALPNAGPRDCYVDGGDVTRRFGSSTSYIGGCRSDASRRPS